MRRAALVGVAGGCGAVGRLVAKRLLDHGAAVRVGSRDESRARALTAQLGDGAEWRLCDVAIESSRECFCQGCDVVVNCVAPARQVAATLARAASGQGANFVDTSDWVPASHNDAARAMIVGAGMFPGLSELLPRILARDFDRCDALTGYVGGAIC